VSMYLSRFNNNKLVNGLLIGCLPNLYEPMISMPTGESHA